MRTKLSLLLLMTALLPTITHAMCYTVADDNGTIYQGSKAPVSMAGSISKAVQAKYGEGATMTIVDDCPLSASEMERRRIWAIVEARQAKKMAEDQRLAALTYIPPIPETPASGTVFSGFRELVPYGGYNNEHHHHNNYSIVNGVVYSGTSDPKVSHGSNGRSKRH